ncbi:hypothetical protein [Nocardia aurea]|uniref:Uncharacterized protein n=1 Tax=Nocardia aurea TaxID=2144174 RepID=A0ABV3G4Z9_9NOCA
MTVFDPNADPVAALIALLETQAHLLSDGIDDPDLARADDSSSNPMTEEEPEVYAIALDESERTPEALEARDRILSNLGALVDDIPLSTDQVERAFGAIIAATPWEDIDSELVIARGSHSLQTRDLTIPELTEYGYHPEVEVEIDLDQQQELATLTLLLEPDDEARQQPLVLAVSTPDGFSQHAVVSEFGVAVLADIPIDRLRELDLRCLPD